MTRIALLIGLLVALTAPARAGSDVGVLVTGDGSLQPQLTAQIESWLSQHGHTLVPSPLPPEAVSALIDCFVLEQTSCARDVVEKRARSSSMIYARIDSTNSPTGSRDLKLTVYWLDKGRDARAETLSCERCTDQSLRTAASNLMRKLVGGDEAGHVKLSSNPPGARITIDGQAIGVTPLDWDLPPGKHTIQMDKAGLKPASREVVVVSNRLDAVGMVLLPPGEEPDQGGHRSRALPFAVLAVGGAAILTGGVLIAIDEDPSRRGPKEIYDTATQGVIVGASGVVVAGIGAYLLWFRSPKTNSAPVAAVTGNSAYVGWLGRF